MKVGLVLEGGAMRGMFTAGVLDVFLDEQIHIDGIVSVSAGALFGVNFPSKQKSRVLRYNKKYLNDKRYMGWYSLFTTGNIVNKEFAFYQLPFELDVFDQAAFARSGIDFYTVLTNVESGEAEYVKIHDAFEQMETLRATSAMLRFCQQLGYDKIIVVLTRPLDYRKTPTNPLIFNAFYRRYPKLVERLTNRYADYNCAVEDVIRLNEQGEIFVIRPSVTLPIRRIEKDVAKVQAMYDLGVADAKMAMPMLKQYLSEAF